MWKSGAGSSRKSARGEAFPAFEFPSAFPKLHGGKPALTLSALYGFRIIDCVQVAGVHYAVKAVEE